MAVKTYKVRFANVTVASGDAYGPFEPELARLFGLYGEHFPEHHAEGFAYQIRDVYTVGNTWLGVFARLREDAPHKVDSNNNEVALQMDPGDRILEKVHFIYYSTSNIVALQYERTIATANRLQIYLCGISGAYVAVNICMNTAKLDEVLAKNLYEIQYAQDMPRVEKTDHPAWSKAEFKRMRQLKAQHAHVLFRAERGQSLGAKAKQALSEIFSDPSVSKIKVRVTDESDPIDLFAAPVSDSFTVELFGS